MNNDTGIYFCWYIAVNYEIKSLKQTHFKGFCSPEHINLLISDKCHISKYCLNFELENCIYKTLC